ncbi:MAG: hypothetical protein J6T38_05385 [Bacteroidaceae bacterium]|nr:hypothetical protein [Bacteroidaceae bacterium]
MNTTDELDIIAHIRGEVQSSKELTGENLFLAWGYPTAFFLLVEFVALILWNKNWCEWIWMGIPLVGAPLMVYFLHKDYERTGSRTLEQNVILRMWIYVGFVSCVGGASLGFAGVFEQCYCMFQGLLIGMGCFLTGLILRYRAKVVCGIIGSALSFLPLFFQGEYWHWQLLIAAGVTIIALVIPGHLFRNYVKQQTQASL